jgi:hypothetical protein
MDSLLTYVDHLAQEFQKSEAEVIGLAFQTGVRQLWRERILGRYLRGEISRDEAIAAAGMDWVDLAERQHQAMLEDLAWAGQDCAPSSTPAP